MWFFVVVGMMSKTSIETFSFYSGALFSGAVAWAVFSASLTCPVEMCCRHCRVFDEFLRTVPPRQKTHLSAMLWPSNRRTQKIGILRCIIMNKSRQTLKGAMVIPTIAHPWCRLLANFWEINTECLLERKRPQLRLGSKVFVLYANLIVNVIYKQGCKSISLTTPCIVTKCLWCSKDAHCPPPPPLCCLGPSSIHKHFFSQLSVIFLWPT